MINFPKHSFKIKNETGKELIFDEFRRQWVVLTPEEWVRQNFLQYLVQVKQYPAALIAVEREIDVSGLKKRFDIVVFKNEKPWMLVECKEMQVRLSEAVISQILAYNSVLKATYIVMTNGSSTFALDTGESAARWLSFLPDFT